MDIPYGFDCVAFQKDEIKYFVPSLDTFRSVFATPSAADTTNGQADFVKFTRKNEDYPREQLLALGRAGRLNMSETDKRVFCGIKIQIGLGVVTNFLHKGLQYKSPVKGRSELVNNTWTGIMHGLTISNDAPNSYDLAVGNFLAWKEEFPHIRFGPFFAVESKLVLLTGGSRRIETSSFGTNIRTEIWLTILSFLAALSLLASAQIHWRRQSARNVAIDRHVGYLANKHASPLQTVQRFFFIYFTMLLNKPSHEFDDLIWPKNHIRRERRSAIRDRRLGATYRLLKSSRGNSHHTQGSRRCDKKRKLLLRLPISIRMMSYVWSAVCLVLASIYSGEMLAVILLHTDQNIDTIAQLINSKPNIEPVIRQDDFTYNLMLKSLDENMLKLHNMTKIIPRSEVYTRQFIESVSERKVALLGDDELIETIYDLYHKHYPLYKSKTSYLQYPISIMYRRDLNTSMERELRRGMVQIFELGLIHRWYQAQKETYIQFYDTYERNRTSDLAGSSLASSNPGQNYKPLSIHHFVSFFQAMLYCFLFAFFILIIEIVNCKLRESVDLT